MEGINKYWMDSFFMIDSDNLDTVITKLYGYSIVDGRFVITGNEVDVSKLDGTGAYIYVKRDGDRITIMQDFLGSTGLYLYRDGEYFAVSNSLAYMIERLDDSHELTFNGDYAAHFFTTDFAAETLTETIAQEISMVKRNGYLKIDISTRSCDFCEVDYNENEVSLDTPEGMTLLDKWCKKWMKTFRTIQRSYGNLRADLSGGYDSRMSITPFLAAGLDMNTVGISSIHNNLKTHSADYRIASDIAGKLGFELNNFDCINPETCNVDLPDMIARTLYVRGFEHKQYSIPNVRYQRPVFFVNGSGGEALRDSHWDLKPSVYISKNEDYVARIMKGKMKQDAVRSVHRVLSDAIGLTDDNDIPQTTMRYCRDSMTRYHFGKAAFDMYLFGKIMLSPLVDHDLWKLKLTTDECDDSDILPAVVYSRYSPELINFDFDSKNIKESTVNMAHELNRRFPLAEDFFEEEYDIIDVPDKMCFRSESQETYHSMVEVDAALNRMIHNPEVQESFETVFNHETYESALDDIGERKFNKFTYGEAVFGISIAKQMMDDRTSLLDKLERYLDTDVFAPFTESDYKKYSEVSQDQPFRVDISYLGCETNDIEIYGCMRSGVNVNSYNVTSPKFLCVNGNGYMLKSTCRRQSYVIKCIGNGVLDIMLRGMDITRNGNRERCYMKIVRAEVNGEDIAGGVEYVWHNEPLNYTRLCSDQEVVRVDLVLEKL